MWAVSKSTSDSFKRVLKELGLEEKSDGPYSGYIYYRYPDFKIGVRVEIIDMAIKIYDKFLILVDLAQRKSFCTIRASEFFGKDGFFFEKLNFKCVCPVLEISKIPGDEIKKSYFQDIFADPKLFRLKLKEIRNFLKSVSGKKIRIKGGREFFVDLEKVKQMLLKEVAV